MEGNYKIPQWTLETAGSTTPCAHHVLSYTDRRAGGPSGETMTSDPGGTEQGCVRVYHATQNILQLKVYE